MEKKCKTVRRSVNRMLMVVVMALLSVAAFATPPTGNPIDTSGYAQPFADLQATMTSVATGPIGLGAFGCLIVGIVFALAWRLLRRGGKSLG